MDTVVACATAWGRAAVAMVRLSGPDALAVARRVCPGGVAWRPRRVSLRRAERAGAPLDDVLAVWMPGPRSFTGEDTVELSCHGNPVIVELLLDACVAAGARLARPGEFTRRALEGGRIDLPGAEALLGLIEAGSAEGVAVARAGLDGAITGVANSLREALLDLAAELEARLDHDGEDLGLLDDAAVAGGLRDVAREAGALADTWRAGRVRVHGARVALVGPVNAGKSSLFNGLVGATRALVSPAPGTTRDVIERSILVDGLEIALLDTAGEREGADELERAGLALAASLTEDVDLRLVVLPLHRPLDPASAALLARTAALPRLVVGTHADLAAVGTFPVDHAVSNASGAGLEALRADIRARVGAAPPAGARAVLLSQRQHALFAEVAGRAAVAADALLGALGPAVAAEEATRSLVALGAVVDDDAREAVLDRLFARFCIGK